MKLNDDEKAMLDGHEGKARQKAMELLVRYAEALGAERFVNTTNVAGVPGAASAFLHNHYRNVPAGSSYDAIFSHFDLDSDELVEVPRIGVNSCHLQGGVDPENWDTLGASRAALDLSQGREAFIARRGVQILKTCTPYLAGNVPVRGEHCAWMESSAVVYCNSVLGARTNTEGRESTSAAMLTGKIPDWGLQRDEHRAGTHRIDVTIPVESVMDWGMLGYFVGAMVEEAIPVLAGGCSHPDLVRLKHFGASAASSGGVEMYHIVGVTPEAATLEQAFASKRPIATFNYGKAEQRRVYDDLNSKASDTDVDFVMLGCPHAAIEQIREICVLLAGRCISANCKLWIFTSRAVRSIADQEGCTRTIREAGGVLLTDTCSAIGQVMPPGTKVVALDSAKQTHYLPAIMGVQAWFGSTQDCIDAALTGRWNGRRP
jgi:hypothetical protein